MAAGDDYIDCSDKKTLLSGESILRLVATYDSEGKPALRVYDANSGSGGGGGVFPTPVTRTGGFSRVTTSGTVSGARSATFYNSGSLDVTVDAGILKPGETVSFTAGMYDMLNDISYNPTMVGAGEIVISTVI